MIHIHRPKRTGLARIELVLLLIIAVVLLGIGFMALGRTRATYSLDQCADRLGEIGRACNAYERDHGSLPADNPAKEQSFLWKIKKYVAIQDLPTDTPPPAVAPFLCPGRRTVADLSQNAGPSDYGCGKLPGKYKSILAGPIPVNTVTIANTGGTGNKIMVGHLGVRPSDYKRGVESGQSSWASGPLSRDPSQFVLDDDELPMNRMLGAPHPKVAPFLFADGTVKRLVYSPEMSSDHWKILWSYNNNMMPFPISSEYIPD